MARRCNWFLVVNAAGSVLAVYGAALGDEASAKARELASLGPVELRLIATSKRPRVGAQCPARWLSIAFAARSSADAERGVSAFGLPVLAITRAEGD